jgi:hypothetical protein
MPLDQLFVEPNRASTRRVRDMAARLSDDEHLDQADAALRG